jgi:SAM-dependent methyltransferase
MSDKSAQINLLNKDFYEIIADSFDTSRQFAWTGWLELWQDYLQQDLESGVFKVLDLGCGNARFYDFLRERLGDGFGFVGKLENTQTLSLVGTAPLSGSNFEYELNTNKTNSFDRLISEKNSLNKAELDYFGLDYTKSLLEKSKAKNESNCHLQVADILKPSWSQGFETSQKFHLIVLFGVMHHLYDEKTRLELFSSISKLLSGQGKFVFTTWNFTDNYLASKITDLDLPETKDYLAKYGLKSSDFLENDYLLDWHRGKTSYRFAHNYTDLEVEDLVGKCSLKIQASFLADGKDGVSNKYWVVGREWEDLT